MSTFYAYKLTSSWDDSELVMFADGVPGGFDASRRAIREYPAFMQAIADMMKERNYTFELLEENPGYLQSGVYAKGEMNPLFIVGWYADPRHIVFDRQGIVKWGIPGALGDPALSFFSHATLIRSYRITDLLKGPYLEQVANPRAFQYIEPWCQPTRVHYSLDRRIEFKSCEGQTLEFDMDTGDETQGALGFPKADPQLKAVRASIALEGKKVT